MQSAVPSGEGAMAAIIGLSGDQVVELCDKIEGVQAANFNALEQTVIAGKAASVEKAIESAKACGAKRALLLPVSVPSHCPLMLSITNQFNDALSSVEFKTPKIKVFRNVDAEIHHTPDEIRAALKAQLFESVQWVKIIQKFKLMGIEQLIECGPGTILNGLIKRIDKTILVDSINTPAQFDKSLSSF